MSKKRFSLKIEEPTAPQRAYSLTDSGTFKAGDLAVNRSGVLVQSSPSAVLNSNTFTVGSLDELKILGVLGKGAGGKVEKALHIPTMRLVALKTLSLVEENKHEEIMKELQLLHAADCPAIVSFYGAFYASMNFYIVLEYMDAGAIADVIRRVGPLPEDAIGRVANQVLQGLLYLHKERHQVHRDIKPSNILLNKLGEVKIADFGVASNQLDCTAATAQTFAGTVNYMAPERLRGEEYTASSDIWSFGLTLAECAVGEFPYPAPKNFWDMIHVVDKGAVPALPASFSPECRDFVAQCLQKDPQQRPSAVQLQEHPFIHKYNGGDNSTVAAWLRTTYSVSLGTL